ncbi:MAG: methyltransferase, partial [Terriglobales bacterium]
LGLLEAAGTEVRAVVQLRCYQDLVLAYDFARMGQGGVRPDYVMGVSPSSLMLMAMTVRRRARATLDLGTGCGIQALLAAGHSERVVGVDCNPRAVAMARFNARFNRIANAEFRQGDMFEPVAGEAFDLIVSNPPFIISPDFRHMFLNSGWENDDVCRRIVQEAPRHMSEGGYCILNANWAVVEGEEWKERLGGWFGGNGCDGLVLQQEMAAPDQYAASLIQTSEQSPEEFGQAFEAWMEYYAERHFAKICGGVIAMRRAGGRANWFAAESGPVDFAVASGADVEHLIALRTWLQARGDRDLLGARLRLGANVYLEQICQVDGGEWRPGTMRVRRVGGIGFAGMIDAHGATLLARCDGTQPVQAQVRALAAALRTEVEAITPGALATIRRLVEQGFLEPVG